MIPSRDHLGVSPHRMEGREMRAHGLAVAVTLLVACSLNQREIARIYLYDDSWDCVVAELEAKGYLQGDAQIEDGKLRVYRELEYVEIEEAQQDDRRVLILRGSTGFLQSASSSAAGGEEMSGASRAEVIEVARACGPGITSGS